jgi:hypothetical protein
LRKQEQTSLAYDCLLALGDGPDDAVGRFNLTFQSVAEDQAMFGKLLTSWLLSPTAAFPVLRDLLGFITAQRARGELDEPLFAAATPLLRAKAMRRLLGLHSEGPTLCQFAASVARMSSLGDEGLRMAADMFNFLHEEFPSATEDFLKPLSAAALRNERGAPVFRGVYAAVAKWKRHLERLPRRPELHITAADGFSLRSARIKLNEIIQRGGEEQSVLASLFSKKSIAQGRRFVVHTEHGPSAISQMGSFSHSVELPSSELSDPMRGYISRATLLEGSR